VKRTPTQEREIRQLAETVDQRALARSVSCDDDCGAKIDKPCRTRHGTELRAEHPRRLRRAERMRDAGEVACSACARLQRPPDERETEPWPEELEWCAGHQQIYDEINEAKEMGCDWP
jgi:hypothetical protein